jgi:hypothetical protein
MYKDILCTDEQVKRSPANAVCLGIALVEDDVPTDSVGRFHLDGHRHTRGGRPEFRFFFRDQRPRLPVYRDGQLSFARWGNGRGQSRFLPRSGWTWLATVKEGGWRNLDAREVEVPVSYGYDGRGVWFHVQRGLRGLLVPDERGYAVAYLICEPPSHYYKNMTGSTRMPLLIGQTI